MSEGITVGRFFQDLECLADLNDWDGLEYLVDQARALFARGCTLRCRDCPLWRSCPNARRETPAREFYRETEAGERIPL